MGSRFHLYARTSRGASQCSQRFWNRQCHSPVGSRLSKARHVHCRRATSAPVSTLCRISRSTSSGQQASPTSTVVIVHMHASSRSERCSLRAYHTEASMTTNRCWSGNNASCTRCIDVALLQRPSEPIIEPYLLTIPWSTSRTDIRCCSLRSSPQRADSDSPRGPSSHCILTMHVQWNPCPLPYGSTRNRLDVHTTGGAES